MMELLCILKVSILQAMEIQWKSSLLLLEEIKYDLLIIVYKIKLSQTSVARHA